MFLASELEEVTRSASFREDFLEAKRVLVSFRLGALQFLPEDVERRLLYFSLCVLASAPEWPVEDRPLLCSTAAEISEAISVQLGPKDSRKEALGLRAALLYELAEMPAMSGGMVQKSKIHPVLLEFFRRTGPFSGLQVSGEYSNIDASRGILDVWNLAIPDVVALSEYEHGEGSWLGPNLTKSASDLAKIVSLGASVGDFRALEMVLERRAGRSLRSMVNQRLFQYLRGSDFPPELFPSQARAVEAGLLDHKYDAWGMAAPTGTGKSFLARLLITDAFQHGSTGAVLYIVPSRALVHEVRQSLSGFFAAKGIRVTEISPQLINLSAEESSALSDSDIVVLTPEKADLILRLGADFLPRVKLVIVDEAHHLEGGTRGILLEFYLIRLLNLIQPAPRIVLLSAVAPNIGRLAEWLGEISGGILLGGRSTRLRTGVYRVLSRDGRRRGVIQYSDGIDADAVTEKIAESNRDQLVQLVHRLSLTGSVLVVAKGKRECENLAEALVEYRKEKSELKRLGEELIEGDEFRRLDSRLEREMYSDVPMREYIAYGIGYHHAGLPPRVRIALENAIRARLISVVFATTTLAEGVNFPFSTVVVQSLVLKGSPEPGRKSEAHVVSPRAFWNIAGRAGRPGVDKEGQVILFAPSLFASASPFDLGSYLAPNIESLPDVRSSLAIALEKIGQAVSQGEINAQDLGSEEVPKSLPRDIRGAVNLIRIALIHWMTKEPELIDEQAIFFERTLAYKQENSASRDFGRSFFSMQGRVIKNFFQREGAPEPELVSELGLSIDTLVQLDRYVKNLPDWQLEKMSYVVRGGRVIEKNAPFVLGPVAKRMAELEGPTLGGIYGDVALQWILGVPLAQLKRTRDRIEDLIAVLYSRVRFLLPWGLYAFDRVVEVECRKRRIVYNNEIRSLAYLSDSGVPSFDALRLVHHEFERVDASRLAATFHKRGGAAKLGVDIIAWLRSRKKAELERIVAGGDRRSIDFDFNSLLRSIRGS